MMSILKLRLLRLREDYLVFIIMTIMALGFTFIFGVSMSEYRPSVIIVDKDQTEYSKAIIEEIKQFDNFIYDISDYDNAIKSVDEGSVLTSIVIEKGFGDDVRSGKTPSIVVIKTNDDRDIFVLENIVSTITKKMINNSKIAHIAARYLYDINNVYDRVYEKASHEWKNNKPISVTTQILNVESKSYDSLKYSLIGFSVFFSMYTIVFGVGTILNDKQNNTWQRIIISPVSNSAILGGTMLVTFLIGSIQLGVLILAGKYMFNIDWGSSISGLLLIVVSFIFAVTCLGLLLSGMVKTHSQLSAVTPIVLTSTAMLGGCMWPLEFVDSKVLLFIANFVPQKWAVEGMQKIAMYGYGFEGAIVPSIVLISMGVVFLFIGIRLIKFE
ncbi:ABC transporter permease [Alkalithermobacter paradoxus]|uniref:ABC-2 family transporter protein n=1 Tax=Alkalithermobacter paradoxus TaxID=29349 RepID=A0A1V4IAX0_9FIRM|nr:ABC-2 family transporter protein [[Clostridium] thermoalcaliphilum]